jgi:uncharacterized protein (DUF2062 family)
MLFSRRRPAGLLEKMRGLVWPAKGFSRPFHYYRMRILRLSASPHAVAAGIASGMIAAWTPFLGFHIVLSVVLAWIVAGDVIAAALATAFANPLTFPFIWAATWKIGTWMLGGDLAAGHHHLDLHHLLGSVGWTDLWRPVIEPMLIGAIPPALVSGLFAYGLTFLLVRRYRDRRRLRLAEGARLRAGAAVHPAP